MRAVLISACVIAAVALAGCKSSGGSGGSAGAAKAQPAAIVNPASVQALAKDPKPPGNAGKQSSIGMGPVAIKTANAPGDTDAVWIQELDIDGDGTVEQTKLLWDDEDKVLFAYAETDVPCESGGQANVALLVGVNAKGNPRGKPAGSGFYAAWFDVSEGGAAAAGLFGAKFNARGNVTARGAVVIVAVEDDVTFVGN